MEEKRGFDVNNCENEPIHIIGAIQDIGYFIVVEKDTLIIKQVSENISDFVPVGFKELIGEHIEKTKINSLTEIVKGYLITPDTSVPILPVIKDQQKKSYNVLIHSWEQYVILEFEPELIKTNEFNLQSYLTRAMQKIHNSANLNELLANTADEIRDITGYDRVMIYKFHDDWHGEVIADSKIDAIETSYFGLHYPASDIPQIARDLFKVNSTRVIQNVHSDPVKLHPQIITECNEPTDLSHSVLRSSSPIHIQYLKNMKVGASMTISLMLNDELWGLISCHHREPYFIDAKVRQACRFMGQLFSSSLQLHLLDKRNESIEKSREIASKLVGWTLKEYDLIDGLTAHKNTILDLIDAGGVAIYADNKKALLGNTPDESEVDALVDWLSEHQKEDILITDELSIYYPDGPKIKDHASGIISAVISAGLKEYIIWFKPEVIQTIYWGGDPNKAVNIVEDANGSFEICPRQSFEKWAQVMENKSEPWSNADISLVVKLREDLLQVIVKKANEIRKLNDQLEAAYRELDTFSYTVSHDLRTPLNAVKVYSEILIQENPSLTEQTADMLSKIVKNADRMNDLIKAVLNYSRIGKIETSFKEVDVKSLLPQIIEDLKAAYSDQEIEFQYGELVPLYGDETMISQVFSNLLSNAVKYSLKQSKSIVKVDIIENEHEIVYSVNDNGIGIDMKNVGKIFQIFSRLTTDEEFEGNGVGMTIVKKIMDRHHGKIWIESELGHGSTFYVAFPKQE